MQDQLVITVGDEEFLVTIQDPQEHDFSVSIVPVKNPKGVCRAAGLARRVRLLDLKRESSVRR